MHPLPEFSGLFCCFLLCCLFVDSLKMVILHTHSSSTHDITWFAQSKENMSKDIIGMNLGSRMVIINCEICTITRLNPTYTAAENGRGNTGIVIKQNCLVINPPASPADIWELRMSIPSFASRIMLDCIPSVPNPGFILSAA